MKTLTYSLVLAALMGGNLFATPALEAFVKRVTPPLAGKVSFQLQPEADAVTVSADGEKITVTASDVNRLAAGYGIYLRDTAKLHWSWNHNRLTLPDTPPLPEKPIKAQIPWKWRQAYNYCTLSYTMAFWDIPQWEEELDRLALSGINMPLVQAGLEKVWQLTLREVGYPEDKIFAFIPNPSAAAWWNMGNLEGHSGPLTQQEIDNEARLGKFIATRARELGMSPILQGFVGLVPHDLGDYVNAEAGYADARYIPQGNWAGGFLRPAVLDPTTETFQRIAAIWYKNIKAVYGEIPEGNPFGGDLFHEGGRTGGLNVTDCAKAVASAMQKAVPEALWVLQAWHGNPSQALLKGVKPENTLILLLSRDMSRGNYKPRSFGDVPWLWCELLNFGGNQNLYGNLRLPAEFGEIQKHPAAKTMQGIGLLSEGLETNPAFYELLLRRITRPKEEIITGETFNEWLNDYLICRYGKTPPELLEAMLILDGSVYNPFREQEGCTETIFCARPAPNVRKASSWSSGGVYYDPLKVNQALGLYMRALRTHPELINEATFRFDLVDLARQVLADYDRPLFAGIMQALQNGDRETYDQLTSAYLRITELMDDLLANEPIYTLQRQLELSAAKAGDAPGRKEVWERAARRLYTTWTGKIDNLNDYAHRQYSGLMKNYYGPRWNLFFSTCRQGLGAPEKLNTLYKEARQSICDFEVKWENPEAFPFTPANRVLNLPRMILFIRMHIDSVEPLVAPYRARTDGIPWNLREAAEGTLAFKVTDRILEPGTYIARFAWKGGANALQIERVDLYEGEKLVASDVHDGWTGTENRQNTYRLNVSQLRTNLTDYTLRAKVKGAGGNQSAGVLDFYKEK